jgi:cytochrome c553
MLVAVLILTVVAAVVALPSLLQSQVKPPANVVPKTTPADFIGAETCKTCHEDAFEQFSATTMGKLFLKHPRSAKEALGCESCHGSGRAHAESGGTSFEGLITFAKKDPTPVV